MTILQEFAKKNKPMFWDVKVEKLDDTAVLERVFCY
jgi:hypothetical protein